MPPTAVATATDHSIAVLPFVNMSSDKEQEYFADGISEELLNLLAQVPELRVIARTSSFSFKGKDVDITEIARRLNVTNVLEGSVRKSGDTLRITAQLVRASDSSHLWSQTYDRQMTDVFKVQDEIAAAVVEQLKVKLLGAPKRPVTDPDAYTLFLQGREVVARQYNREAFEQAIALYKQALTIDPSYAPAWNGLANVYFGQIDLDLLTANQGLALGREAIRNALEHDPSFAPAYGTLAKFEGLIERDYAAAARHVERALSLDPANLEIVNVASHVARRLGRLELAIALGKYQVERDPVSATGYDALGAAYRYRGQLTESIAAYRKVVSLSPDAAWVHMILGSVLLQKGDADAALAEFRKEPSEAFHLYGLAMAYHALGWTAAADVALAELIQKYTDTKPLLIAAAQAYRGDFDQAFEMLEKADRNHDLELGALAVYPSFAPMRKDPRWLPLLRRLGLAPEQLAAIKFDVKVPQ
jgi:TolB-like protein/Tfp pilus assembly protein PilF